MTISRTPKDTHLDTIKYELDMANFCYQILSGTQDWTEEAHKYVYLESFLLHYRNLIEFYGTKGNKPESLAFLKSEIWSGRKPTNEELVKIHEPAKELMKQYWENISVYLQHCTEQRKNVPMSWDVEKMYADLQPIINLFYKSFLPAR
jgi:hypothetical protein